MGEFRKLSEIISVDDSGSSTIFRVNGQWEFTLPDDLSYEIDAEWTYIKGGIDLSGSTKPLVLKEDWSKYEQAFCAAVEKHYSFTRDHTTIIDCKYDNRFSSENNGNHRRVVIDEEDFYVDILSVNTWPFGVEAQIRVRGDQIVPYNITMMVKPEDEDHWKHIAAYFRQIADSICKVTNTAKKAKTAAKKKTTVDDPNCIMSGTVLQKYIGQESDVVLPEGITALADNIFSGRGNLRSIVIPEGVKEIGSRAFENCRNLQRVTLPKSIKSIGGYAFVDCHKLESIELGDKLEHIESSVFSECFKLDNVTLPTKLKDIDAFAFKNCREFTRIIIPEGVESIGFTAFAYCENLEYLYIPASVTGIYDNFMDQTPFDGCENLTIRCPEGSYAAEYAASHNIPWVAETLATTSQKAKSATSASANSKKEKGTATTEPSAPVKSGSGITPVDNTSVLQKYYATARAAIDRKDWKTVRDTYSKIEMQCPGDLEAGYFIAVAKLRLMDGSAGTYQRKENVDRFINALRSIIDNHRKIQAEEIMPLIERIHISIIDVTKARFVFKVTSDHDDMLYLMGLTAGTYERMLKELLPYVPGNMENNVDALCSKMIEAIAAGECESDSPGLKMTIREEIADVHKFWKSKNPNHVIPAIYSSVKASNTNYSSNTSGGCYVATAVYGSYDCPQVWTLRRFRDNTLAETWYGRAFIRTYYAISPTLVKWFGHIEWLKKMWKSTLDRMVAKLNAEGVEDTPYEDRHW